MKEYLQSALTLACITAIVLMWATLLRSIFIIDVPQNEKLQLEIQHLKYQVGIDSLRYDMELNFYEKRHAGGE